LQTEGAYIAEIMKFK